MKLIISQKVVRYYTIEGLKKACDEKGISMREAAKRLGISAAYLCDISHGRRYCSKVMKQKIEKVLS